MKFKLTYYLFFILFTTKLVAQNPIKDSIPVPIKDSITPIVQADSIFVKEDTIQTVFPKTYWNINDKKRYNVTNNEVKLVDDTLASQEQYTYNVIVEV